ncbi:MAG TPA: hypothetical protein VNN07_19205 [Candidatus Tectomicrobia bacterium]|nr:hypothetical protein [Candidatus Tectomicrobia bacterium]
MWRFTNWTRAVSFGSRPSLAAADRSRSSSAAPPRPAGAAPPPAAPIATASLVPPRKLFIVAQGNDTDYQCLKTALAKEEGTEVEIIFDRRTHKRGRLRWLREERRRNPDIDRQLRTRGWAVHVREPRE